MSGAAVVLVAFHLFLLACYTLPPGFVPARPRYWSQAYARVLFHQDWRLFAPDPPACPCSLEVRTGPDGTWRSISTIHPHFIWRRMSTNACRYVEASIRGQDTTVVVPIALSVSLENMTRELPRKGPLTMRLRSCDGRMVTVKLPAHR